MAESAPANPATTPEYYLKLQVGEMAAALAIAQAQIYNLQAQIAALHQQTQKPKLVDKTG